MTPTEIFITAIRGLAEQGAQSTLPFSGRCAYRGREGMKCAVGILIPDDIYVPAMEACGGIECLLGKYSDILPCYFTSNEALLADLQVFHDADAVWTGRRAAERQLNRIMARYGINAIGAHEAAAEFLKMVNERPEWLHAHERPEETEPQ